MSNQMVKPKAGQHRLADPNPGSNSDSGTDADQEQNLGQDTAKTGDDKLVKWLKSRFQCKVHRLSSERENADLPIAISVIGFKRRVIEPGKRCTLHGYHIQVLRDAVLNNKIDIQPESAIYEAADPKRAAENSYPGFTAVINPEDGMISVIKTTPMYSVEIERQLDSDGPDY